MAALIVLTLEHPESKPELDDWGVTGGTRGNHQMSEMLSSLAKRLSGELGVIARPLPYQIDPKGVPLKDAAMLAGLGVIGANNLLITPQSGPRVRLRALAVSTELESTGAPDFDPCDGCARPCFDACPRDAFLHGRYERVRCARQMARDESRPTLRKLDEPNGPREVEIIRYCRACELACPVGRDIDPIRVSDH